MRQERIWPHDDRAGPMEIETEIIIDKKQKEIAEIFNRRIREGWHILSSTKFCEDLWHKTSGQFNKVLGSESSSGSIYGTGAFAVTYIRLSDDDRHVGSTLRTIAEKLSKN